MFVFYFSFFVAHIFKRTTREFLYNTDVCNVKKIKKNLVIEFIF